MEEKKVSNTLQLSLGSNIELRLVHLQKAILLLKKQVGTLLKISKVYETPAWGFESTPFYNICVSIQTSLTTKEALKKFQEIEIEIGRLPKKSPQYEQRPIDIDILYSSEGIFNLPNLVVPHPLLQERKFVLVPLQDIAPLQKHPILHKTTQELLLVCKDNSTITNINRTLI